MKEGFTKAKQFLSDNYEIRYNIIANEIEYKAKNEEILTFSGLNENDLFIELCENHVNVSYLNLRVLLNSQFVRKYNPIDYTG